MAKAFYRIGESYKRYPADRFVAVNVADEDEAAAALARFRTQYPVVDLLGVEFQPSTYDFNEVMTEGPLLGPVWPAAPAKPRRQHSLGVSPRRYRAVNAQGDPVMVTIPEPDPVVVNQRTGEAVPMTDAVAAEMVAESAPARRSKKFMR